MTNKNFDNWNIKKKITHQDLKNKWVREREVWFCSIGVNIGTEEDGKGTDFLRPVLVVRVCGFESAMIVPLTSKEKKPSEYYYYLGGISGLPEKSTALISQMRLLDTRRFARKVGKLEPAVFLEMKKAIRDFLK
jgi:mRNA interferase MazF